MAFKAYKKLDLSFIGNKEGYEKNRWEGAFIRFVALDIAKVKQVQGWEIEEAQKDAKVLAEIKKDPSHVHTPDPKEKGRAEKVQDFLVSVFVDGKAPGESGGLTDLKADDIYGMSLDVTNAAIDLLLEAPDPNSSTPSAK